MKRSVWAGGSVLALAGLMFLALSAQPLAQQATPAKPDQQAPAAAAAVPPDVAALNEAMKTTDPQKQIAALQKVIADYPKTDVATMADSLLMQQLTTGLNRDLALLTYVEKRMADNKTASGYGQVAGNLLRMNMPALLELAEDYAKKGVAIDEAVFVAQARESAKLSAARSLTRGRGGEGPAMFTVGPARGTQAPTDQGFRDQYKTTHANLLSTLGQIYAKRGKTAKAERTLKEAYAADMPASSKKTIAGLLADAMATKGDAPAELEYRATAFVLGSSSAGARPALDAVYKKTHNGSLDGMDAMLDALHHKLVKPLEVEKFARPKTATPRLVLAEVFTGAACPPCVAADMAFDAVLERYARQDVALVVYHQHIPGPDPMTNPFTEARKDIYALRGVPTFAIDGKSKVGGGGAEGAARLYNEDAKKPIEERLAVAPEAQIRLTATLTGSTIKVKADLSKIASKSDKLKLQIVLVEESQRYSGPNGVRIHPMVVRASGGADMKGFPVVATKGAKIVQTFDVAKIQADNTKWIDEFLGKPFRTTPNKPIFVDGRRDAVDTGNLMVVAFLQDEDPKQPGQGAEGSGVINKKVLQTAYVKVAAPAKKATK